VAYMGFVQFKVSAVLFESAGAGATLVEELLNTLAVPSE